MGQTWDQSDIAILNEYPNPLAVWYQRALGEQNPLLKPKMLAGAFEALIKYCAILALQDSYRAKLSPARFSPATIEQVMNIKPAGALKLLHESLLLFRRHGDAIIDPALYLFLYDAFKDSPALRPEISETTQKLLALAQKYPLRGSSTSDAAECEDDYQEHLPVLKALWKHAQFLTQLPLYYFHDPKDEDDAIENSTEETISVADSMMGINAISQAMAAGRLPGAPFGRLAVRSSRPRNPILSLHPLLMLVETIELSAPTSNNSLPIGPHVIIFFDEIRGADQEKLLRFWQLDLPRLPRENDMPKLTTTSQGGLFSQIAGLIKSEKPGRKTRKQMAQQVAKLLAQRNILAAIQEFKKISESETDNYAISARLGELYFHGGLQQEAIESFTKIAERCIEDGLVPQAMLMYQRVSRLSPGNIEAGLKLANICAEQGCDALALDHCQRIAEYTTQANLPDGTIRALELAVQLRPREPDLLVKLANTYLAVNKKSLALKSLLVAGEELLARQKHAAARKVYESVLEINPFHQTALASLGQIYLDLGEHQKAIDMLAPLCQSDPANTEMLSCLGRAYLNSNQLEAADETFSMLFKLDKTCYENLLELGRRFLSKGDLERVGAIIERCLYTLIARGKERHGSALLESCLAQDPNHLPSLKRLIDLYLLVRDNANLMRTLQRMVLAAYQQDDLAEAKTALRQLVNLDPQNPTYLTELRALEGEPAAVTSQEVDYDTGGHEGREE